MSLRVWLPLNGTLDNQGCSNITILNSNATVNTSGKIGSCYYFNASAYLYENTYDWTNFNSSQFSLCCWYKEPSPVASGNSQIICIGTNSGWNNIRIGLLRRTSNGYPMFSVSNGSTAVNYNCTATTFTLDTWNHIACTYNNGEIKIYLNGILNKTYTTTIIPILNSSQHLGIGAASNGAEKLTGYLNDIRIYDHCLSAAEVKEISQGLVLHYKLDDPYSESSTFLSCEINNTAYNASIRKYGYNADSNLSKTIGVFQGKQCVKISTINAGVDAQPYTYFSNLYTSNGTNAPAYKALSFDYFTTCPTTTWLNIYKLGDGTGTATWTTYSSAGIRSGTYTNSQSGSSLLVEPNEWNHIEVILHGTTDANAQWGYCINGPKHTSNANYYFLYANIQLEQNDHVTGQRQDLHKAIIYDSSGYGHNAVSNGSVPVTIDSDTPKYSYSTKFVSGARIAMPVGSTCLPTNAITVSIWYKSSSGTTRFLSCTESGGWNFEVNSSKASFPFYIQGKGYSRIISTRNFYSDNQWHMITVTYDGISTGKWYWDGILDNTITIASGWENLPIKYNANTPLTLGAEAQTITSPIAGTYVGNLSDLRIYCTALSADDILQLYHTGAKIDNKQNLHTYELVENFNLTHVTKRGQTKCQELTESTTTKFYDDFNIDTNTIIER